MRRHIEEAIEELRETVATFNGEEVRVEVWPDGSSEESKVVTLPGAGPRRPQRLLALERHLTRRQKTRARLLFFRTGRDRPDCVQHWPDENAVLMVFDRAVSATTAIVQGEDGEERPNAKYSGECLEAVVAILDERGKRATASELVQSLCESFGDSTVRNTVSGAVKVGRLTNTTRPDRYGVGYGLVIWRPEDEGGEG